MLTLNVFLWKSCRLVLSNTSNQTISLFPVFFESRIGDAISVLLGCFDMLRIRSCITSCRTQIRRSRTMLYSAVKPAGARKNEHRRKAQNTNSIRSGSVATT